MRTKSMLLAAALMAAGVATSMAQSSNVYSLNVVGYYNITIPAGKFYLAANQLQGTNGDNTINTAFSNGAVSDPNGINNTACLIWNGAGFTGYQFFSAADSGGAAGYYDALGNLSTVSVNQGSACFIHNFQPTNITITVVGQVVQGTNIVSVPGGFTPFAITPPISTNIDSAVVSFPASSPGDGSGNTFTDYLFYNGSSYVTLNYFNSVDSGGQPGFYDLLGNYQSTNTAFMPAVGQGFFIHNHLGTTNWVSSFTVQ